MQDTGFQGFKMEGVEILQPDKKPRRAELTDAQKESNRQLSRRRVRIEHVNSSVKLLRILSSVCAGFSSQSTDLFMNIACSLHNLRVVTSSGWTPMT
jgi:hypothetical protein